ncbi:uncharacterized protein [Amphiura filiformis]|uniref:uncharacterized protein n=1 Tax=Amphiura filiformis TaxID=82378 RepID=UPI003B2147D5
MATDVELVYKGWLKKSSVSASTTRKSTSFLSRSSNNWKKRFFLLLKRTEDEGDVPYLEFHDKECTGEAENPKGSLKLWPNYRVEKKHDESGKTFVFEVKTPDEMYRLQAESETIMDLWVFYAQIQTKLRMDFPGHFFEVMPDDSDSMRRIGAKGSKCVLHISPWGLTLALKRTKSLLAQWPLTCIRMFECSETGAFSIDAGRSAPMGQAQYIFNTSEGDDGQMYDLLDDYTNKLIERQVILFNVYCPPQPASEEEVAQEYERFRLATFGLLPGTKPRTGSVTSPPSASISVPMAPQRPLRKPLQELPAVPGGHAQMRHNVSEPALRKDRPPLPPRNYPTYLPPSASLTSGGMPKTYASPYDHEDTATLEGAAGGALRASATESELLGFARSNSSESSRKQGDYLNHQRHSIPGASPYEDMKNNSRLLVPSPYENTARLSFPSSGEHSGISISPQDMMFGGFANPAFIASPQQSLSKSPWYHEIRGGYGHQYMPQQQILHTYLDPQKIHGHASQAGAAEHYASPPTKPQLRVVLPPEGDSSLRRSHSFDNLFGRMSLTSSGIGSPLLDTLDLAHSMTYASPRLSVGLPKTPSHTGMPPEFNAYIGTPHQQMMMVAFPQAGTHPSIEENPQYEKMAQQEHTQSFNNNNQGTSVPHYMPANPQQGLSAPLAVVTTAMPLRRRSSQMRMKRSHSEADLLDCKKMQDAGYMTMQNFAGYMDMEKGYLAKLKAAANEAAEKKARENLQSNRGQASSDTSPYMTPRNALRNPEQVMTEQEMEQSLDTFATARRKKAGSKLSKFFGTGKTESDDDGKSGSASPHQSPRKYAKSPSQALIGRMRRSPKKKKDQKMTRSRSEPDLQNIIDGADKGYMDMRKSSFGSKSQMKRANSDFDLLDDNMSTASGDSVRSEPCDRIVYTNRKKFQSNDGVSSSHVPSPVPLGGHQQVNGQAVKPASHSSVPSSAPTKKRFQLKMFRQSKSKNEQSPAVSSTESSPDTSRSSRMAQPSPSPKPKLSKLKIPKKSFSSDAGIVPSNSHKSFGKRKSSESDGKRRSSESDGKSKFYLSEDHESVTELSHRPLPTLPRGVTGPDPSQQQFAHALRVKPPSPLKPIPVPIPQVPASYRISQEMNAKGIQMQAAANQIPDSQFIEEYSPTRPVRGQCLFLLKARKRQQKQQQQLL